MTLEERAVFNFYRTLREKSTAEQQQAIVKQGAAGSQRTVPTSNSVPTCKSEKLGSPVYSCYFVPGYRISRQVMFTNIKYYLGPCASARPFSYQQSEGYLVSNLGRPLTKVGSVSPPLSMLRKFQATSLTYR